MEPKIIKQPDKTDGETVLVIFTSESKATAADWLKWLLELR